MNAYEAFGRWYENSASRNETFFELKAKIIRLFKKYETDHESAGYSYMAVVDSFYEELADEILRLITNIHIGIDCGDGYGSAVWGYKREDGTIEVIHEERF